MLTRLRKVFRFLFVSIPIVCFTACGTEIPPIQPEENLITNTQTEIIINPNIQFQIVDHIGVSGKGWAQVVGGWQKNNRQRVIDYLFDANTGIGLSSYRYTIGAGGGAEIQEPWFRTESFEIGFEQYDWNRDSNAIKIIKMIRDKGVVQFSAVAYSPPPRLTKSGMVTGSLNNSSNLGINKETEFARYLVEILKNLAQVHGINIEMVSPINEPSLNWTIEDGREGSSYTPQEAKSLISSLNDQLIMSGLDIQVLAPESYNWSEGKNYIDELMMNPGLESSIEIITIHSNESSADEKKDFAQYIQNNYPFLKIWMTEWSDSQPGRDYEMDSAINLAMKMHEDFTLGGVSAWQYWLAVSKFDTHDGLMYIQEGTQIPELTKKLWTLGQYSKFVRPGDILILAQSNDHNLHTSAFYNLNADQIAVVVVNTNPDPLLSIINIESKDYLNVAIYSTSQEFNLSKTYQGTRQTHYTFPGLSVTTLLFSN